MSADNLTLPRLLYVGDVPVEASYHGSALIFRLLEEHPADRLRIVETCGRPSLPERRLKGVAYRRIAIGPERLLNTRLSCGAASYIALTARHRYRRIARVARDFRPDAVLTVTHGFSWRIAAEFADRFELPLHLICHDYYPTTFQAMRALQPWLIREFGRTYRFATSRLCVSPRMEEAYRQMFGAPGVTLYPSRARDCISYRPAAGTTGRSITGAYAGTINSDGCAKLIRLVAEKLHSMGGRLLLFGPHSEAAFERWGLAAPCIESRGLVKSAELIELLHREADFLFMPMTFENFGHETNMEIAFPSKLTDYTASGAPLLIWGPEYSAAVRWARAHGQVAEVVASESEDELSAAIERLTNVEHRTALAEAAATVGNQLFSYDAAKATFYGQLCGEQRTSEARTSPESLAV